MKIVKMDNAVTASTIQYS